MFITSREVKWPAIEGIFAVPVTDKRFISKIYKNKFLSISKEEKTWLEKITKRIKQELPQRGYWIGHKYLKIYSILLVIQEFQIKSTITYD